MKKLLLTSAASVGLALGAFAQGSILVDNAASINYGVAMNSAGNYYAGTLTLQVWERNGASDAAVNLGNGQAGGNLAGYAALNADGFTLMHSYGGVTMVSGVSDGTFSLGELDMAGVSPAASAADIALVVFTGSSYGVGGSFDGVINFLTPTANYLASPKPTAPRPTGWNAFGNDLIMSQVAVPEPTTFALAGLGAAALLIFRRRK